MKEIIENKNLVAYCGLYCGACRAFRREKCNGCHDNNKASWCKIRTCCIDNRLQSCADCNKHPDLQQCSFFNNLISRIFAFIFRSDRKSCIEQIRSKGITYHTKEMASKGLMSIRKVGKN